MPVGDKTEPLGEGPVTGRGLGYCTKHPAPGYANSNTGPGYHRGLGYRGGVGRGRRNQFRNCAWDSSDFKRSSVTPSHQGRTLHEEWESFQENIKRIDKVLKDMKKRIAELEAQKEDD